MNEGSAPHAGMVPTLLIVDDDPDTCDMLALTAADAGYRVRTATSFLEAKSALQDEPPDLMVVDVRLGGFNGLQLIIGAEVRVPAIVISGFHDATLEEEARSLGADFLEKPIDPVTLLAVLATKLAAT